MKSFQAGDNEAFQELYHSLKKPLFFFIMGMTKGHEELSEELTHEAFLKLYKSSDQFNHSVKFTTWFWTIARNLTIDELRKKNPLDWIQNHSDQEDNPVDNISDESLEVESLIIEKSQREELYSAIEKLKARQREVIMLRIASELTYDEISQIMGLKPNALKALFLRAKTNLEKNILSAKEKSLEKVAT